MPKDWAAGGWEGFFSNKNKKAQMSHSSPQNTERRFGARTERWEEKKKQKTAQGIANPAINARGD